MSFTGCLVIEGHREWQIIVGDKSERLSIDVDHHELPICLNLMLERAKLKQPTVVLAPASASCFFCLLKPADLVDVRDRQAMLFELENHLPIDAEATVADFVPVPTVGQRPPVAAIAIAAERWQAIVESFEAADLPVRSIVPASILATRAICSRIELSETTELFLSDDDYVDVIDLQNETMLGWKHLALDAAAINRHKTLNPTKIDRTFIVGRNADELAAIIDSQDAEFVVADRDTLIVDGARLLLETPSSRWFELRRGALAPSDPFRAIGRQLRWVGVAAAACLLALAVGGWWRTQRIEQRIEGIRAAQADAFRKAFPDARMPGAVLRRVRSEHSKVRNSRGQNTEIEVPVSAPDTLRRVLAAIPTEIRYRITRIEITNGEVDLLLQVKNTVDAGKIATAISGAGFQVDPPGTRRVDPQTFESDLKANLDRVKRRRGGRLAMESTRSRQRLLIAFALAVLGVYALLSVRDAWSAYHRLEQARGDFSEVQQKLAQIEQLKQAPRVAALDLEPPDEIVNRVAAALQSASLPQSALSDQTSSDPQRVQRSDFKLRSITIKLAPATLLQIVRFCDALRDEETGTTVRDLTLTEPKNSASRGSQEKWEAELVLTQMIFSPTSG